MSNSYTWQITPVSIQEMSVDGSTLNNVYTTLHYRLIGTCIVQADPNVAGSKAITYTSDKTYGDVPLAAPDPASFVTYPVAAATLASWLVDTLGSDNIDKLKANVDNDISAQQAAAANPTTMNAPVSITA